MHSAMNEKEQTPERKWVAAERGKVIAYLSSQGCDHAGVGDWTAFHIDPYVALWTVQSPSAPGRIGWWAISGDLPTDYMSSRSGYHPRDAMRYLSTQWLAVSDCMDRGRSYDGYTIGPREQFQNLHHCSERVLSFSENMQTMTIYGKTSRR
jgi:hypothetical protein